jgi:uncharacterized metal-binding protein
MLGCSGAVQMANDFAIRLDSAEEAEMSCIASVVGDVGPLVSRLFIIATSALYGIELDISGMDR